MCVCVCVGGGGGGRGVCNHFSNFLYEELFSISTKVCEII